MANVHILVISQSSNNFAFERPHPSTTGILLYTFSLVMCVLLMVTNICVGLFMVFLGFITARPTYLNLNVNFNSFRLQSGLKCTCLLMWLCAVVYVV